MQVYPIGISLADAAIVGVTLRLARGLGLGFAGGMSAGRCGIMCVYVCVTVVNVNNVTGESISNWCD